SYVAEIPLRKLNIGGGIDFVAVDAQRQCRSWPNFIIEIETEDTCTSREGKMILQLGSMAYAIFRDEFNKPQVVSLNIEKSSIIKDLPDDSIYLRRRKSSRSQASDGSLD